MGDRVFYDPAKFPWTVNLEANWQTIRHELDAVLGDIDNIPNFQEVSPDQYYLTQDNDWRTYFLYGYGYKIRDNCAVCPQTTQLVEQIPGLKTAFFSILLPHKKIPEHAGPYKGVLRYHLGLKVPQDKAACGIRVLFETRNWAEGKSLVFDDSFPHQAWNDSDEVRVILFVDFVRPLRFPYSLINQFTIWQISRSAFVQKPLENLGNKR